MSESYVQVPLDGTGKKIRTRKRTIDSTEVHEQAVFISGAVTPTIYNVTMTNANTEYSQSLPSNCKKFLIHTRDGTSFRLAFVSGKVASPTPPYFTVPAGQAYYEDFIEPTSLTLYFACGTAGKVVEIIAWS